MLLCIYFFQQLSEMGGDYSPILQRGTLRLRKVKLFAQAEKQVTKMQQFQNLNPCVKF